MRGLGSALFFVAIFTVARGAVGQQPTIPLSKNLVERYGQLPVAGGVLVGVVSDDSVQTVGTRNPAVYLPANHSQKLCLSIQSKDGTYSALAEYSLANLGAGTYGLSFSSSHAEFKSMHVEDLASLAQTKESCSTSVAGQATLPVSWTGSPSASHTRLLFQADHAVVRVLLSNVPGKYVQCVEIRTGPRLVFDTECNIPASWKPFLSLPVVVDVNDFGDHRPTFKVLIVPPQ